MYQITSELPEFCGRYYEKHLGLFFLDSRHTHTHCSYGFLGDHQGHWLTHINLERVVKILV